jgi:hypothetical protein
MKPIAIDVTPEAEAAGYLGPRVALSTGCLALTDHVVEAERLRRVGLFVIQVVEKARDAREDRGVRVVTWANHRLCVLEALSMQGQRTVILCAVWEAAFAEDTISFDIRARGTVASGWLQ